MNAEMKNSQNSSTSFGKLAQVGFVAGSGNGFSMPKPPAQKADVRPQRVIIRKKKSPVSFERRFLSARSKNGGNAQLEIAMIWRGNVVDVRKFGLKDVASITLGSDKSCTFNVETGMSTPVTIAHRSGDQWLLLFDNAFGGFILQGDKKTEFKTAKTGDFEPAAIPGSLAGALSCKVQGDTRAKYVFGEVTLLVHYVDAVSFAMPMIGQFRASNVAAIAASLFIHLAFFSVVFFSTDRVNALMVDRVLTVNRFATVVEPEQKVEDKEDVDEIIDDTKEEPTEVAINTEVAKPSKTPGADNGSQGHGPMDVGQARSSALNRGMLADGRMDSIMGAVNTDSLFDAANNWSTFDSGVAAEHNGFLLGQVGTGVGSSGGNGTFDSLLGTGRGGGEGGITTKAKNTSVDLGKKGVGTMRSPEREIDITGSLDKRLIQKVVNGHKKELRACYESELLKVKNLNGKITVEWMITPQGNVSLSVIKESTMHNPNVERCITNYIKFWRFPTPKGGGSVMVEYPFVFEVAK